MRPHILPMVLLSCVLTACDSASTTATSTSERAAVTLKLTDTVFTQQGGNKCPKQPVDPATKAEDRLCATVKFSYPVISSGNTELDTILNNVVREQLLDSFGEESSEPVQATLAAFAESFIQEYKQDSSAFTSWEIERQAKVVHHTEQLLTLLVEEFGFTGGAHPFSGSRFVVLSLRDGKRIELADLLNAGFEPVLNVEGEKAFRDARQLPEGSSLEEEGFTFENNAFVLNDNFGVNKEGLSFIFNSYEVAPYVMGPTEFTIPYENIRSLIRPDGLLGKKAQ